MAMPVEPLEKRVFYAQVITVVGLSKDESKPSNEVARYLLSKGKKIIPVNPTAEEILGLKCYPSLLAIPPEISKDIDMVDVFRRSGDVPQIAKDAIALRERNGNFRPGVFWMQLGIVNGQAAQELKKAGFKVVMDRCAKIELSAYVR